MYNDDTSRLARLCITLKGLRDEAVRARADSGIEQIWTEDREYYDGIDDHNREYKILKPSTSDGRVIKQKPSKKTSRSTIFLNITKRYVNAAAAHVADKLFRSDVSNYGIKPTPKPSLVGMSEDMSPATDEMGQPMMSPVMDEQGNPSMQMQMFGGQPMMDQASGEPVMLPEQRQMTKSDLAKQQMDKAKDAAEKAKNQIDDWLTESSINGQSRQIVVDGAMIGTGVLKGPCPEMVKSHAVLQDENGHRMEIEEKLIPKSRRISAWNLYPDPSCGTDIHRGKYIFEDDEINSRLLMQLRDDESYIASAIDRVLDEGPKHAITGTSRRSKTWIKGNNEIYQIWYYHGYLTKEDLEACGYDFEDQEQEEVQEESTGLMEYSADDAEFTDDSGDAENQVTQEIEQPYKADQKEETKTRDSWPCVVVMVNDTIIKATISPFDSGRFPYNVFRWEYRDDHWAGCGVARQMRTSQDGVNAGVRMLHDNAGVSSAPILIIDRSKIIPADGVWAVGPHKVYYTADDSGVDDIRKAFTWVIAPSMQQEMMGIITFWMNMAEEETGLPMILQGQQADGDHTLGEAQLLNNNGSAMLRRVTNIYDDDVTKPHIGAYYEWLMIHGDDNEAKGDFTIEALGSSVLIERDANSQLLMQMLGAALNPAYEVDPVLVFKEFVMSQRFDYEKIKLSDEKKKELASRPAPEDPRIVTAKMTAESKNAELNSKMAMQQADQAFEAQQAELNRALEQYHKNVEAQIVAAQMAGDQNMNNDNLKVALSRDAMKLRTQVELAMKTARAAQVANPAMEPQGRAPTGQAFQR